MVGHMAKMAAIPIYGKNLKTIFSGIKMPMTLTLSMLHQVLECYQVCSNDDPGLTLTYDIKLGRCSQLNEYMKLYEYQRSRSFIDLGPKHSDSIFVNFFSSIAADFNISSALR